MNEENMYVALAEKLKNGESKNLIEILRKLISPQQAKIIMELPNTPEEIAKKLAMETADIEKQLDDLFIKGVVFPKNYQTREGYRFARNILQLHDTTQAVESLDPVLGDDFFDLWEKFCHEEFYVDFANLLKQTKVPGSRVLPAYKAIKDIPGILPCEDVREILRVNQPISLVACSCRRQTRSCEKTKDFYRCIQFGRSAEYSIARGAGKELSYEEALAIIDANEEDGLVYSSNNSKSLSRKVLCSCCRCCCVCWVPLTENDVSIGQRWAKSRFQAEVDQTLCDGCQTCIDRCQFDAIEMIKPDGSEKYTAMVDAEKCWGCGVCTITCNSDALSLKLVRPEDDFPEEGSSGLM